VSGGSVTSEVNCAQRSSGCGASVVMIAGTGGAGSVTIGGRRVVVTTGKFTLQP